MRSFLPKFLKSKTKNATPKTEQSIPNDVSPKVDRPKKMWRFKMPKKYRTRKVVELGSQKANLEMKSAPVDNLMTSSVRRIRRPNMATTQRKLAASQRRLRYHNGQPIRHEKRNIQCRAVSRSITYPTMEICNESSETQDEESSPAVEVRRAKTGSSFVMGGENGVAKVEVEFTDDGESMIGDEISIGRRKTARHSLTIMTSTFEPSKFDNDTPSKIYASSSVCVTASTVVDDSRTTDGVTEWESASDTGDEADRAWAEFHREQVLAKLAGMVTQNPTRSEDYRTRKAMRINPHKARQSRIPQLKRGNIYNVSAFKLDSALERKYTSVGPKHTSIHPHGKCRVGSKR